MSGALDFLSRNSGGVTGLLLAALIVFLIVGADAIMIGKPESPADPVPPPGFGDKALLVAIFVFGCFFNLIALLAIWRVFVRDMR